MELRLEGFDLLHQSIDELLRAADGQRGDVVDGLVRIELGALTAGALQRVEEVGTYPEQAQFEHLEQPTGTGADIDAAMAGNICRCGTYQRIRAAIHRAAELAKG